MKTVFVLLLALVSSNVFAESPAVYEKSFDQNLLRQLPISSQFVTKCNLPILPTSNSDFPKHAF